MSVKLNYSKSTLTTRKTIVTAVSAAITASAIAAPVVAQGLEEVVVTATKRSESVMDVPLAITAISGEMIRETNLDDIKDLVAYTPGVTGNSKDSFIDLITVRGILTNDFGIGGDPSVGLYKNGLYQGRNGSAVTSLYDIASAEVLRGPQGFLFGRGAISGAMNIHTVKPTTEAMEGYVQVDAGERGRLAVEGAINIPVGDNLAFRLAGYHSEEDGYVKNVFPGADNDKLLRMTKTGFVSPVCMTGINCKSISCWSTRTGSNRVLFTSLLAKVQAMKTSPRYTETWATQRKIIKSILI